jgi:hypothetical protein
MDTDTMSVVSRVLPEWVDILIMLGVILLVAAVVFFWALSIRKRKNRIRKYRHHHHRPGLREQLQKGASGIKELAQKDRSGRRHRSHRTINPTLAQTGGLPPLREADNPPPAEPQP